MTSQMTIRFRGNFFNGNEFRNSNEASGYPIAGKKHGELCNQVFNEMIRTTQKEMAIVALFVSAQKHRCVARLAPRTNIFKRLLKHIFGVLLHLLVTELGKFVSMST